MDIELNKIFYASLLFGYRVTVKTVLAHNRSDAIEVINEYYNEPIIITVVSLLEMMDMVESTQRNGHFVMSLTKENGQQELCTQYHDNISLADLQRKYPSPQYMVVDKSWISNSITVTMNKLFNSSEQPLISPNFIVE